MSTPQSPKETTQQQPIGLKLEEYITPEVYFAATTAPLTSHVIIDAFEERNKVHSPEMTFFQNSLVITHRNQNLSLTFTTPESILGTIYTPRDSSTIGEKEKENSNKDNNDNSTTTTTTGTSTEPTPTQHSNPQLFIPTPVQVQSSQQWQKHLEQRENRPESLKKPITVEDGNHYIGDWTYSTLYQGQLYINNEDVLEHTNGFFSPQFPFTPAKLHNTLDPDRTVAPLSPSFEIDAKLTTSPKSNKDLSPTSKSLKLSNSAVFKHDPNDDIEVKAATSPFLQRISKLIPQHDLLTENHRPEAILATIPHPELPLEVTMDKVPEDMWVNTTVGIDYKLLSNKNEKIDFYSHIILFEDELHDNGTSNYTIRIRVMKSCYYVLVRNFLRVDDVVVRIRDTRYFYPLHQHDKQLHLTPPTIPSLSNHPHSTATSPSSHDITPSASPNDDNNNNKNGKHHHHHHHHDWLYRETKVQEATFDQLKAMKKSINSKDYTEEFSWVTLPTLYFANHRIDLNKVKNRQE